MNILNNFLNKRFSLRRLTDIEFREVLPLLSKELTATPFTPFYTDEELTKDWNKLLAWSPQGNQINSTSRIGIKLCEHFSPNFYDIKDRSGKSFRDLWGREEVMSKVLEWNRRTHSTPYLSELRRGIYFCGGLCKSTMYRPQMAKMITSGSSYVLDPCMGWGGRLLGTVSAGSHYIGFEPNTETFSNLNRLVHFLNIQDKVTLVCDDALNMDAYDFPKVDVVLTSPPYYDLEVYSDEETQSIKGKNSYDDWVDGFLSPLIQNCLSRLNENGKSCWNVAKVGKYDMWKTVDNIHSKFGFTKSDEYVVKSSARQVNQTASKNKKSVDTTVVYGKMQESK